MSVSAQPNWILKYNSHPFSTVFLLLSETTDRIAVSAVTQNAHNIKNKMSQTVFLIIVFSCLALVYQWVSLAVVWLVSFHFF